MSDDNYNDNDNNNDNEHKPQSFATLLQDLNVDMRLRKAVARMGIAHPTLVQSQTLNLAIASGRDIVCRARTGSGKTLAYLIPVCHKILLNNDNTEKDGVQAVVLVPTKELVTQVYNVLQKLTYYCHDIITCLKIDNSMSRRQEAALLRDVPRVIIATPAGLLKHVQAKNVVLKKTGSSGSTSSTTAFESLVIDEADLILSFGYMDDVTELVVKYLPKICQGFLMSATLSPELDHLKKIVLHSPAVLKLEDDRLINKDKKAGKLMQFYLALPREDKQLVLFVFLKLGLLKGKGLFFVNSTDGGYRLKLFFEQFHIRSAVLNAELPLQSRMSIIEGFNAGNFDYLIATDESMNVIKKKKKQQNEEMNDDGEEKDEGKSSNHGTNNGNEGEEEIGEDELKIRKSKEATKSKYKKRTYDSEYGVARGLDFRGVSFVVNVDFPVTPESYTHRVGRTARGGANGVALSLVNIKSNEEINMLNLVQDSQPKLPVPMGSAELSAAVSSSEDAIAHEGQPQPSPLQFDLKQVEGFRYRVEDVSRAVTKVAVRETRAAELRVEILNSERLKKHFEENPSDLQLLRHDRRATHVSKVKDHLKNVPSYLLPRGMHVADLHKKKKRKKTRSTTPKGQKIASDPLKTFDGSTDLDGVAVEEEEDAFAETEPVKSKSKNAVVSKLYIDTSETGISSSGRRAWKERHKKKGRKKISRHERS